MRMHARTQAHTAACEQLHLRSPQKEPAFEAWWSSILTEYDTQIWHTVQPLLAELGPAGLPVKHIMLQAQAAARASRNSR